MLFNHAWGRSLRLLAVVVFLFVASPITAGATHSRASVTLTLWEPGPDYQKCTQTSLAAFQQSNPSISVHLTMLDWGTYQTQIVTGVAGGSPPDLIMMFNTDVGPWANQGLLTPVNQWINSASFLNADLASGTVGKQVYAVPWGMQLYGLAYRTDFLTQAGLKQPPTTWAQLSQYARKLTKHDSSGRLTRSGLWLPTTHPSYRVLDVFRLFLANAGGSFFNRSGTKATFNSPQGVAAGQFLQGLLNKDKVDQPGAITDIATDFANGKVAMQVTNSAQSSASVNPKASSFTGLAPLPTRSTGMKPVLETGGHMLGMTATSRHKAEASKLLRYLTSVDGPVVQHANCNENLLPSFRPAYKTRYGSADIWIKRYRPLLRYARQIPPNKHYGEVSNIVTAALGDIYLHNADVKQALDSAASKANSVLSQ